MSVIKKTLGELCIIEKGKVGIQKAIPGKFPLVVTAEERLSHNEYHFEGNAVIIPLVSSTGHGFLYTEAGWNLSPAFDINPNETGTGLKLNIDEADNSLDIDLVMNTAPYYLLSEKRAEEIKEEVTKAVFQWRKVASKYKIPPSEIERKAKAFLA